MKNLINLTITLTAKKVFAYGALGILLLAGIGYARWALAPSTVLIVHNSPVPVKPPEVRDGDKVFLDIDFCKTTGSTGQPTVNLLGTQGAKIAINWPADATPEGCNHYKDIPVPIPAQTQTDIYTIEFVTCYDINPIKKERCTTFTTRQFKVVNDKLNPGDAKVKL